MMREDGKGMIKFMATGYVHVRIATQGMWTTLISVCAHSLIKIKETIDIQGVSS